MYKSQKQIKKFLHLCLCVLCIKYSLMCEPPTDHLDSFVTLYTKLYPIFICQKFSLKADTVCYIERNYERGYICPIICESIMN